MLAPMLLLAALLLQAAAPPPGLLQRATACGLGTPTVRFNRLLDMDVLSLPGAATATDAQLSCLDEAATLDTRVELATALQPRFDRIRNARAAAFMKSEATSWLTQHGLLERAPRFTPGTSDPKAYVRAVEAHCGPAAAGALSGSYGPGAIDPAWLARDGVRVRQPGDVDPLACMLNVTALSGYPLGFIGNETYAR
jgi:hypothetical protein